MDKKTNEIRADTSKFSERIAQAKTIDNLTIILHDMSDKARTEEDTNEVADKYAKLQAFIKAADWAAFPEGTF